jgi:hypothetical protein
MREPLPQSIGYLRVCGPLTCRHQKEMRCLPVCVVKRQQLGEQRCLVPTCYNTPLVVGLLASIMSRLLAAGLATRHSQVSLGKLPTPGWYGPR